MSQPSSPLETALDLLVYLPVGLALTVTEEAPRLAAKGRERIGGRVAAARLVGQFAVGQGRRMMAAKAPTAGARPASSNGAGHATAPRSDGTAAAGPDRAAPDPSAPPPAAATNGVPPAPGPLLDERARSRGQEEPAPLASSLAIPGYDSLSASQVVQRLAGLSGDELDAVGRYEAAGRGRRTILARVSQLQSQR